MTELDKAKTVTLEELMVSTLAMADAVTNLLIAKGVISEAEFKEQLLKERATYQTLLQTQSRTEGYGWRLISYHRDDSLSVLSGG
jgi:hypothetical protein